MDRRSRLLKNGNNKGGSHIVYWMSRDQRTEDNWALLYAQNAAIKESKSMSVVFCLYPDYPRAQREHFDFMLAGLLECQEKLKKHNIPMHIIEGNPSEIIPYYLESANASLLVSDFSPLKINLDWKTEINKRIDIPHVEVDTRNIVPCFVASDKKEYGAYTIRPKIHKLLDIYLKKIPKLLIHPIDFVPPECFKIRLYDTPHATTLSVLNSGSCEAMKVFNDFIQHKLKNYHLRNDPNAGAESNLSKFLHFGQISSQRIALEVINSGIPDNGFLEELIIRRELADNFCYYEKNYDSVESFPDWAKNTLELHKNDTREYIYDISELESSATHDDLWNAAQNQMRCTGYMNGYMRMYWAKKILEWSPSAEKALEACILLNDRYMMDGRDPNGYAGIAWSIGGVHDRAWKERAIFGKIRYMNYNGCKRKFDIEKYIRSYI